MKLMVAKLATGVLLLTLVMAAGSASVFQAQETDDPAKIAIYDRFYNNRDTNKPVAYQAARDYLVKYIKDKDQYVDYLQKWVADYESNERKRMLPGLINEKNFAEAYKVGAKILADEPDYLRAQIDLGYAGYLAAASANETYNADALAYARKAIQAIDAGKVPSEWAPYKGKVDTLAYLHYAVGYLTLKTAPEQAIDSLIKAALLESEVKKIPLTYHFLAIAYETGPYKRLSAAYQTNFAGKDESPQSKAALEKINVVIDRMIDAYARAVATSGTDAKMEANRKTWMTNLTAYWKFRHEGAETGLPEFIATVMSKPLPPKPVD
jgi:hypothetical protein